VILGWSNVPMLVAFVSRPIFFADHIKMVTWAAAMALDDLEKDQASQPLKRSFSNRPSTQR